MKYREKRDFRGVSPHRFANFRIADFSGISRILCTIPFTALRDLRAGINQSRSERTPRTGTEDKTHWRDGVDHGSESIRVLELVGSMALEKFDDSICIKAGVAGTMANRSPISFSSLKHHQRTRPQVPPRMARGHPRRPPIPEDLAIDHNRPEALRQFGLTRTNTPISSKLKSPGFGTIFASPAEMVPDKVK